MSISSIKRFLSFLVILTFLILVNLIFKMCFDIFLFQLNIVFILILILLIILVLHW